MLILNKLYIAIGAAVVLVVGGLWIANARLRADLADNRADLAVCRVANNAFAGAVAEQNARVERLRTEAAARVATAGAARAQARADAQVRRESLRKLMRAAPEGADRCKATEDLFNTYWRDLR